MASTIAIIATQKAQYSETFIKQHIDLLKGNKKFYYGGVMPTTLDGSGSIVDRSVLTRITNRLKQRKFNTAASTQEYFLSKSLKKEGIGLVLAEYGPVGAAVCRVCQSLNVPLIVHFHGADAFVHETLKSNREKYQEMFAYASYIIVVSEPMHQQLLSLGCPPHKLVKNIYGPHPSFSTLKYNEKAKKVLAVGRFVDKKAPYYTILAFAEALKKHPDVTLHMAGDGPLLNTCKNLVKHLGVQQNVVFEGVISPEQLHKLLEESCAFIQHSIMADNGDSEGCPVAIIEASAAGLPVIATRHAGIPEVIIDGKTGLLVDEHDVAGMSEKMIQLLNDRAFARNLGDAGKSNIQANFTLQQHIQTIDHLIASCLS